MGYGCGGNRTNMGSPYRITAATRIAGAYALFASLWVLFSDRLLGAVFSNPADLTRAQTWKGWLFVTVTSVLVWVMIREHTRRMDRAQRELHENERRLRSLYTQLAEAQRIAELGSWEWSKDTGELRLSEQMRRILGTQDAHARIRTYSDMAELIVPEDREAFLESLQGAVHERRTFDIAHRIQRPDGEIRELHTFGEALAGEDGRLSGCLGVTRDVTERNRAEREARRQREELAEADKMISLGILVSGVAHEINNPTHSIMLNVPLIRQAFEDALPVLEGHARTHADFKLANLPFEEMRADVPRIIDEIREGAERIRFIVSELKNYARREDSAEMAPLHVNDVVEAALTLLAGPIKKATTRFSKDLGEDLPPVRGNLRRLEQVVINLVLNACQALPDRERAVRVATLFDPARNKVCIVVEDEGRGIRPEDMNHIKDPFFTTRRESGGTGLGLAVSARITEEHGGRLDFTSEPDRGTRAVLSLPACREETHHDV